MHAISSIVVTNPETNKANTQTDRGDYNTLRRSFASAQCNKRIKRRDKLTVMDKHITSNVQISPLINYLINIDALLRS